MTLRERIGDWLIKSAKPRVGAQRPVEYVSGGSFDPRPGFILRPETMMMLYRVSSMCPTVRTCVYNIKREIFRNWVEWEPVYVKKCIVCGEEYQSDVDECENCENPEWDYPNEEYLVVDEFTKDCNFNHQTLKQVCEEMEEDLDICDNCYMIVRKSYELNESDEIVSFEVEEVLRGNPIFMMKIIDERGLPGGLVWTCIEHRDFVEETPNGEQPTTRCPICNRRLYEAFFKCSGYSGKPEYYIEGEVIAASKYSPSLLYGYPPVMTLWNEIVTLIHMGNLLADFYRLGRYPRGIIAVNTQNWESLNKQWDAIMDRMKMDPYYLPVMGIENDSGRGNLNYVPFSTTFDEMDYIPNKDDLRQRISSFYGVSNIFMSDSSTGLGLSNEGLQILVTNRAVQSGQEVWNEIIFPQLVEQFGVTDHNLVLISSEQQDDMAELQREDLKIKSASAMLKMGFDVKLDSDGNFVFSGEAKKSSSKSLGPDVGMEGGMSTSRFEGEPEVRERSS